MKEKIHQKERLHWENSSDEKTKPQVEASNEPKRKYWKFYLLPGGKPQHIARNGLVILLFYSFVGYFFSNSIIGDFIDIIGVYGVLLLLSAFIIWFRNKVKDKRRNEKEDRRSVKERIKRYLPDILILIGIWTFFYVTYFPISGGSGLISVIELGSYYDYSNHFKLIGIILITIGINIVIRKYFFQMREKIRKFLSIIYFLNYIKDLFWLHKEYINKPILEILRGSIELHNKSLRTLSSGALILSFTFVQLLGNQTLQSKLFIKSSWILFGASIIAEIIFEIFLLNFEITWRAKVEPEGRGTPDEQKAREEAWGMYNIGAIFQVIQYLAFFGGIISLVIFMFYNF